jgi:uncharacterized membrane protein
LNAQSPSAKREASGKPTFPLWGIALAILVLTVLLIATPGGILDKADLVGSAVCHRIESHSFSIAGRQLPLCARCTGTFLGALIGFFGQVVVLRRRRAAEFPPAPMLAILASFTLFWAADGVNSYLALVQGPHAYEPQNWLRLTTGALNGLTMSIIVYPLLNITLWQEPAPEERNIRNLGDLSVMLLLEMGLIGLVLTQWEPLLYPIALLSASGVLALLTSVNSVLVMILTGRENVATNWAEALAPLLAGFTVSLLMVGVIDLIRYITIGVMTGMPLN